MQVTAIKTHKITTQDKDILEILDQYIKDLKESSVVAVTSKIVSICEGRVVEIGSIDKDKLIEQEAELYLPRDENKYNVSLTVKNNTLIASAGIDESNGNGYYILWPQNPQKSVNQIRAHLRSKFNLKNLGVIITDSKTTPLRWGVTAIAIAYCGFNPLKDYIQKPDLFGRPFVFEKMSIVDNLACSAAIVMGEGDEQTPIAIIEDLGPIEFQDADPTEEELKKMNIKVEDDLYYPLLKSASWRKGKEK